MRHRRKGREFALQCLYSMEVGQVKISDVQEKIVSGLKANLDSIEYGRMLVDTVLDKVIDIDEKLSKISENWSLERMTVLDKILIRCAVAEMMYMKDIPREVSITEAIQLARKYSTVESSRYINGVLDSVSKNVLKLT